MKLDHNLQKSFEFVAELDKLKSVYRQTVLTDRSRNENSAEHSWHAAMTAIALAKYANEVIDINKVVTMLLVHDVVEIDAGDVNVYDLEARKLVVKEEQKAAVRVFGLLPGDSGETMHILWQEYESGKSAEAKYAQAIDRLIPMYINYLTQGATWQKNNIHVDQVLSLNKKIADGSEFLWQQVQLFIKDACDKGWLRAD